MEEKLDRIIELLEEINSEIKSDKNLSSEEIEVKGERLMNWLMYKHDHEKFVSAHGCKPEKP